MDSEGVSSGSRRRTDGLGGRSDRSSSTQGVFVPEGVVDRDGVAPKCRCGLYAVLYMSKTANNPNILFFRCPFFKKDRFPHCKFFLWLDKHTQQLANIGSLKCAEKTENVDQELTKVGVENMVAALEERVAAIERKKKSNLWLIVGFLFWVISVYMFRKG